MAVIATGFFDGVHLGHRQVIQTLVSSARQRGEEAIVVTFTQHPRAVLQQDAHSLRLLNSPEEKVALLRGLGVDRVELLPFDRAFARLTAGEYLQTVLCGRLGATQLVLGYDNRIGSDRLTPDRLAPLAASLGLEVVIVPPASVSPLSSDVTPLHGSQPSETSCYAGPLPLPSAAGPSLLRSRGRLRFPKAAADSASSSEELTVSSTKIREALAVGNVEVAEAMLGYAYTLRGIVVSGKQLGRTIGFPTANLRLYDPMKMIPARGVYLTEVEVLGSHYWGMTNVSDPIETHIFDFAEDIYGLDLRISFRRYLRAMRNFDGLEALKTQLAADEATCRGLLEGKLR